MSTAATVAIVGLAVIVIVLLLSDHTMLAFVVWIPAFVATVAFQRWVRRNHFR